MRKFFSSKKNWIFLVTLAVLLVTVAAFGEEPAEHEEAGVPRVVYYQALNFFALLAILYFALKSKAGAFFKKSAPTLSPRHSTKRTELKNRSRKQTPRIRY